MGLYVLEGHQPVPCEDFMEWAVWMDGTGRQLAFDSVGSANLSTVFLGIDLGWLRPGGPILFETLIFDDTREHHLTGRRYQTWDDAMAGHAMMLSVLRAQGSP